ncbi:hemin-degrading factor [Dongia sp.]|uniref:hemin-degrading factor n=1 Tax=Dongia sp. TaxID=1977262 RepID=UPI0035AFF778
MQPSTSFQIDLASKWAALRQANPHLRNRDAAEKLKVSEAELVASALGQGTVRLTDDWKALFSQFPKLGRVMALTRNEEAVHERRGAYEQASFDGHVGLVLGPDIDLRIFLNHWRYAFAVEEAGRKGLQRSLQIFDSSGTAVHKIYAEASTDLAAWAQLVGDHAMPGVAPLPDIKPADRNGSPKQHEVDRAAFLDEWAAMQDTHEFFGFLRRHRIEPTDAFRLAEGRFTTRLEGSGTHELLTRAAAREVPIMVFVGNPGIIQIHTGPVQRIERVGDWLNVLDAEFNLHLREDRIAETWLVRKPTADGTVTSVELFNPAGGRIGSFFGKRKPGEPELGAWRELAEGLATGAA